MDEAEFMETKLDSPQGRPRARQGAARPKAPQGCKYSPLGAPRG
jgi:hypothetical protein